MTERLSKLLQLRHDGQIQEYRDKLKLLTYEEATELDIYLKKVALGEIPEELTGYPSLDKVWLKYYNEDYIRADIPHLTAIEYMKKMNSGNLDRIAVNANETLTYRAFFLKIDQVAASLHKMGVSKGHIIMGILPAMTAHEMYLLYAADTVGAAATFMAGGSPVAEICTQIRMFNIEYLFVFDEYIDSEAEIEIYTHTNLKCIINISLMPIKCNHKRTISWQTFLRMGIDHKIPPIDRKPEDLLFIAKTGGTTGKPKNVMLNDNSFNIIVHQYLHSDLDYNAGDKWLRLWSLFSATAAVSSCHLPLCAGMENILRSLPSPDNLDKMIVQERPNHLLLIPVFLDCLEKSTVLDSNDLSYLKTIGVGGVSITENFEHRVFDFLKKHDCPIFLGYGWGCTENGSSAAMRMNSQTTIVGMIGIPLVKTTVGVFDPHSGKELGYGEEGELCIKSYSLMMGYYGEPELTKSSLKTHQDGCVWLHTGDIGSINTDGFVRINGRMTRSIFTYMGPKVYPAQLEEIITKVPGVTDVAVVGIPDARHESFEIPICFVVIDNDNVQDVVSKDIAKLCEMNYPEPARPKQVYFKSYLPLTPTGKPDIKGLEQEAIERTKSV